MKILLVCGQIVSTCLLMVFASVVDVICTNEEQIIDTKTNGLISAFGDFDSDRFTDVFFISDRGKSLHLLKSYEKKPEFRESTNLSCTFNHSSDIIVGVIPGDFNGDAMMDLMIVTQKSPDITHLFNIWIFKGDRITLDCNTAKAPLLKDVRSHPLILDYNGDMIADFIVESKNCTRELWIYNNINKQFTRDCPSSLQLHGSPGNMRFPHSNAFVNIQNCNGKEVDNFSTDIFISGKEKMEYWFDESGYNPASTAIIAYPDSEKYIIGQSLFIDLRIDGCIQHIMPVCEKQKGTNCDPQILWYNFSQHEWVKISSFNDNANQTNLFFQEVKTTIGFELPISVRFGDVDGDGFVDLLSVMKSAKDDKTEAVILRNVKDDSLPGGRKFVLFWTSEHLISDNVELASFLDVQENGRLDVIMSTRNATDDYNIIWIRNMLIETSCFLKVLVTTGLCGSNGCPGEKVQIPTTNQAGLFVCYETSDMDGKPIKGCSTQLSQSAHFALQMPYSVFGLGETPNFVESVQASIPSGEMKTVRKARWTQIVPDAQVVLIPYPPNETTYWICKLFYTPSSIVFSTLATLGVLCIVLVLIILILHRKEVLEDLAEHEEYKRHWPESR